MLKGSVGPLEYAEMNGFNEESIRFAKYYFSIDFILFLVNNHEIKTLHKLYKYFAKNSTSPAYFKSKLAGLLQVEYFPFFDHLFLYLEWNIFFQTIMFISFAPTAAILFTLIHTLPDSSKLVGWKDILNILKLFRASTFADVSSIQIFKYLDINDDGFLSFNQFLNFASQRQELWCNLSQIRLSMVQRIWNGIKLLDRRKNIQTIKTYRMNHNGKYPPEKCTTRLKHAIYNECNINTYDYDTELDGITMNDLTTIIIKKYHADYKPSKECFAVKYLSSFTQTPILHQIDEYYLEYRKQLPQKMNSARTRSSTGNSSSYCINAGGCVVGGGGGEDSGSGYDTNGSSYVGTATTPVMNHSILRDSGKKPSTPLHNQLRLSSMMKSSIKNNNNNNIVPLSPANTHTSLTSANIYATRSNAYKTSLQRVEQQNSNYINLYETIPENNQDHL